MNAGGAATSAGMDFQNRVVAIVLAHMLADMRALEILGIDGEQSVESLACETADSIDDLRVTTTKGVIFVQAKRSVSLSEKSESEYSSVIRQFVQQSLRNGATVESYVLATTPRASSKITRELRKIAEAARLDKSSAWETTLNASERETLEITREHIKRNFGSLTGREASPADVNDIFAKIQVAVIDIDPGSSLEQALFVLLRTKANVSPELIWSSLLTLAAHLASNRQSIDRGGLTARLGQYVAAIAKEEGRHRREILEVQMKGHIASGREVVLAEIPPDLVEKTSNKYSYGILEFRRFDDTGAKRLRFGNGHVYLPKDISARVLCRASSYKGLQRFVSDHPELIKDQDVVLIPIKGDSDFDATPFAKAYSEHCDKLLLHREDDLCCLHCGDPISENGALMIEIDEQDREQQIGNIHRRCHQPLDRILGFMQADMFDDFSLLKDFDYRGWFSAMQKGQALFAGLHDGIGAVAIIAWNPRYSALSKGEWCVRINLEDGSARYAHERGRVTRESRAEADETVAFFNSSFATQREKKDPCTYTSLRESFAPYSINMKSKLPEETCITCVNAEPVRFTREIDKAYSLFSNFYTPLLYLVDAKTGKPLNFLGSMFLLSDPLKIANFYSNWKQVWPSFPEFKVSSILSDAEFDKFVAEQLGDGVHLVIDPLFDLSGNLVKGHPVVNYEEVVSQGSKKQ